MKLSVFSLLIAALIVAQASAIRWRCRVTTSNVDKAGTGAHVYVRLFGANGHTPFVPLGNNNQQLEQGYVDDFYFNTIDIGSLTQMEIKHDDNGWFSGWHLNQVEMLDIENGVSYTFTVNQWLKEPNLDVNSTNPTVKEIDEIHGIDWRCRVFTSDVSQAGTGAHVSIQLYGAMGDSPLIQLHNSDSQLERGYVDDFHFHTTDIGALTKMTIQHDHNGWFSGWHLNKVELLNSKTGRTYIFVVNQWLKDHHLSVTVSNPTVLQPMIVG